MERTIQDVARLTGTTSRTLRHYGELGLVVPSRVGDNGYRYYDERALVRLQRVLLLRGLGLGLPAIAALLDGGADEVGALRGHLDVLREESGRLDRRMRSVQSTIDALERGEELMAETMFDGFDHTEHREEVSERWGADAYASGDRWWRSMSPAEQREWKAALARLNADWRDAAARGADPAGEEAQALARRHVEWLRGVPGVPGGGAGGAGAGAARAGAGGDAGAAGAGAAHAGMDDDAVFAEYLAGLGDMYVADERFAANYGGAEGAAFVRDALRASVAAR